MRAAEWALLEWLMPASTWLQLELFSVPNLAVAILLLAAIGTMAVAMTVVVRRCGAALAAKSVARPPRTQVAREAEHVPAHRPKPTGGSGPRAPSLVVRAPKTLAQ